MEPSEAERRVIDGYLRIGRGAIYAIDRALRSESNKRRRLRLFEDRAAVQADVDRLTEALGA